MTQVEEDIMVTANQATGLVHVQVGERLVFVANKDGLSFAMYAGQRDGVASIEGMLTADRPLVRQVLNMLRTYAP